MPEGEFPTDSGGVDNGANNGEPTGGGQIGGTEQQPDGSETSYWQPGNFTLTPGTADYGFPVETGVVGTTNGADITSPFGLGGGSGSSYDGMPQSNPYDSAPPVPSDPYTLPPPPPILPLSPIASPYPFQGIQDLLPNVNLTPTVPLPFRPEGFDFATTPNSTFPQDADRIAQDAYIAAQLEFLQSISALPRASNDAAVTSNSFREPPKAVKQTVQQKRQQDWDAAKSGMWDNAVDIVTSLASAAISVTVAQPYLASPIANLINDLTESLKSDGPPSTGDYARDRALQEHYEAGSRVIDVTMLASSFLPIGEILQGAKIAVGKIPAKLPLARAGSAYSIAYEAELLGMERRAGAIVVNKAVPAHELNLLKNSASIGKPGAETFVTLPYDTAGSVGKEAVFDRLTLGYKGSSFPEAPAIVEFRLRVPNTGFRIPEAGPQNIPTGTGFTWGGAMELQMPARPLDSIEAFRVHFKNGTATAWQEFNPFVIR